MYLGIYPSSVGVNTQNFMGILTRNLHRQKSRFNPPIIFLIRFNFFVIMLKPA